jgi:hypothetical protein
MSRLLEDRGLLALLDDPAEVHDGDLVADVLDHGEIVRDEDVGQAELLLDPHHQVDHLGLH